MTKEELLKEIEKISIDAINNFYLKLGLDFEDYKKVHDVKIIIDDAPSSKGEKAYGCYLANEDEIIIDADYIQGKCDKISGLSDERERQNIIRNVAVTLIHEKIHAMRRIQIPENALLTSLQNFYISRSDENEYKYIDACDFIEKTEECIDLATIDSIIDAQKMLEEGITEALADMILISYFHKFKNDSLVEISSKAGEINFDNDLILAGLKIINIMGVNMIKWFLTTRFNKPYKNLFIEIFNEDYMALLNDLTIIEKYQSKDMFPPIEILQDLEEIIIRHQIDNSDNLRKPHKL